MNTNNLIKLILQEESKELTISEAIQIFFNKLKLHNRPGTINYYKVALKPILASINKCGIEHTNKINNYFINKYVNSRLGTVKNITINKEVKALQTVLNYLIEQELINSINFKFKPLEQNKTIIEDIDKNDIIKILNYFNKSKICKEYQLTFILMLTTGIRTNELLNIKNSNIDLINKKIYLEFTKSKKPRYIYLVDSIIKPIEEIISDNIYLFNFSINALRCFFKKLKKQLDIKVLSPHKLRHYYANYIYNKSLDIYLVSQLLGHAEIKTTQIYLSIDNKKNQIANEKYNPIRDLLTN